MYVLWKGVCILSFKMASRKVISLKGEIVIPILGYVTEKNGGKTIENAF